MQTQLCLGNTTYGTVRVVELVLQANLNKQNQRKLK